MEISKVDKVKKYIFKEIEAGRIKSSQRLPSCREVATFLSVNKITVNKAYHELENEHKVYCISRGGFYLVDYEESFSEAGGNTVDFSTVKVDDKLIPYREFTNVMNNAVDMYKNSLFAYQSAAGLISLRDTLKHQYENDGVYTSSERIIITNGAQQAIWLVLQSLYNNKRGKLLVESPTYGLVLKMAELLGIDTIGIEKKSYGYDFNDLEHLFKSGEIIAFYIIPRHHNPTGYSLSEKEKLRIVDLSLKYDVMIIEDDYLADLGSKKYFMPMHYYDTSKENVAYIRSFSKTFMPGIRLGAVVLPKKIYEEVLALKHISDLNTSLIQQAALDLFIKSGMYEKHIKKVRKSYEDKLRKSDKIFKTLNKDGFGYHVPEHGIFIWLQLPQHIEATELEKKFEQHGTLVKVAKEFFPEKCFNGEDINNNCIRFCISGVSGENMDALATVINEINNFTTLISSKVY